MWVYLDIIPAYIGLRLTAWGQNQATNNCQYALSAYKKSLLKFLHNYEILLLQLPPSREEGEAITRVLVTF
jgi:cellulose biosynthesis protein BcsQ